MSPSQTERTSRSGPGTEPRAGSRPVDGSSPTIAVIGAGPYGIAAARALRDLGHDPLVLERGPHPAMTWRGRHDHLHLNTIRWLSHLPGRRMPRRFGPLPARDDYVGYLERAADELRVRTATAVERIDRHDGGWTLATPGGPIDVDHVVVSTGPDTEPVMPHWPGEDGFTGELIHAADFDELAAADGRRLLVVGPGNSGVDLMNHLVDGDAAELVMSARGGMNILPERMFGLPTHPMAVAGRRLPAGAQDAMMRSLQRAAFGDLTRYGYPRSQFGVLERIRRHQVAPAIDAGFVEALKAGKVRMRPSIERFDGPRVVFEDGSTETPDIVVCATGYRPGLEGLLGHLVELDRFGFPELTSAHRHAALPGLWFFGMDRDPYGNLSVLRSRARRLRREMARVIASSPHADTPREMAAVRERTPTVPDAADVERLRGFGVAGVPHHSGHVLAMRRFPGSSVGPGYTSIWHRDPRGRWVIYQDVEPRHACPRAFGPDLDDAVRTPIGLRWTGPHRLEMTIDDVDLRWEVDLTTTPASRLVNSVLSVVPTRLRHSRPYLAMARGVGPLLGAGRFRLDGRVPSGQRFIADMRRIWMVQSSRAEIDGTDLGAPGPLPDQDHLADFWIPQRGLFGAVDASFERHDPARHRLVATRHELSEQAA